jgi:hypothetical protein
MVRSNDVIDADQQLRDDAEQRRRDLRRGKTGRPNNEAARLNRGLELMEEHDIEADPE